MSWRWGAPILLFFTLLLVSVHLGLTDDEAYYWVLAQKPSWGYAYHPPMVAWWITLSERLLGIFGSRASVIAVRLPAAFLCAGLIVFSLKWLEAAAGRVTRSAVVLLLSFGGVFAFGWMMVPDLPLFFFWGILFERTWRRTLSESTEFQWSDGWVLALASAGILLSKYSGVLALGSAGLSFLIFARGQARTRGVMALVVGGILAAIPILWWNSHHGWASLLYQFKERHGEFTFSGSRWARYWAIQSLLAGPAVFIFFLHLCFRPVRNRDRNLDYVLVWALPPALVFFTQAAFADFKPHWTLVVWWPVLLGLAYAEVKGSLGRPSRPGRLDRWASVQRIYGIALMAVVYSSLQVPWIFWGLSRFTGKSTNPLMDVTNDLYGWSDLPQLLKDSGLQGLPVVGSRYQTAAQASFVLSGAAESRSATLLPRDLKSLDEWPHLSIVDSQGPNWPSLAAPLLFVADQRYSDGPEFKDAQCELRLTHQALRWGLPAKTLKVWKCVPFRPQAG